MFNGIRRMLRFQKSAPAPAPVAVPPGILAAIEAMQERYAKLRATYDAARTSTEMQNIWANADHFDADSAHSPTVRQALVSRSRYEIANNGYADGIASTYATDLVGVGPTLRMQTGSDGFNRMVELTWFLWTKATHFRRKLWCMAHAKHGDGEGFGVVRRNPNVKHPIPLDVVLYETEQCHTPYLSFGEVGYIDGIKFDSFGNPEWYDLLHQHPGGTSGIIYDPVAERVPAEFMLHWFKMRRPGQHRGVPESSSTLNTGAAARRWREATLAAAETAADFSVILKTAFQPDQVGSMVPMDTFEVQKRMMTAVPAGWDANQMRAEHPNAQYEAFHKTLINEQARPKSMPFNKAACDSSSYNYASGRLDHQTYYAALDVEREDGNDLVLDPLFSVWFDLAVVRFGWLGGNPEAIGPGAKLHLWDWPKHRVADVEAEANANQTKLKSGQAFPHSLFSDAGLDFEDELEKAATSFGVDVPKMRKRLLDVLYPEQQQGGMPGAKPPNGEPSDEAVAAIMRSIIRRQDSLAVKTNGNGVHHG